MWLPSSAITFMAANGAKSLRVPDDTMDSYIAVGQLEREFLEDARRDRNSKTKLKWRDCPDEWFCRLNGVRPSSRKGLLHLTRTGYEANKAELKKAYLKALNPSRRQRDAVWEDYEQAVETHFRQVFEAVQREEMRLQKQLQTLAAFVV